MLRLVPVAVKNDYNYKLYSHKCTLVNVIIYSVFIVLWTWFLIRNPN